MSNAIRNVLAIIAGIFVGGAVNMALVVVGGSLVPPPAGVDVTTAEGLKAGMHLMQPRHFAMPFLAHALGTLVGALVAYLLSVSGWARSALVVGVVFLAGGVAASRMVPAPTWFVALDLVVAYLPMAWLATRIGARIQRTSAARRREA